MMPSWPQNITSSSSSSSSSPVPPSRTNTGSSIQQQRLSGVVGGIQGGTSSTPSSSSSTAATTTTATSSSSSSSSSAAAAAKTGGIKGPSYKTVLLGDASVGKSSLVLRFVKNTFSNTMETTIGAAFFAKTVDIDGEGVKFEVWDTAGQERFSSLAPMYYRGAAAAIIVYDQTNGPSYERAKMWVQQLQLSYNPNIIIALAANKADINNKQIDVHTAKLYAEENQLIFLETSARTGLNVQLLFQLIARRLKNQQLNLQHQQQQQQHYSGVQTLKLTNDSFNQHNNNSLSSRFGCCASS
ncbi:Ras family domain-containing protein, putative [Eimeria maxima]|uniref:Ras family domain-containing protein, putative n=1 Tax=Eimeria maxima TaxID=5804 RepID=U6M5Q3_EIMMA|nr:Ras family domain-containing protein, putative [Eimeria maxima]CDJ59366.1 Ras family domain-containing protein, putative [Eimeria maxima]